MRKKLVINKKTIETTNLQTKLPHEASSASLFILHQQANSNNVLISSHLGADYSRKLKKGTNIKIAIPTAQFNYSTVDFFSNRTFYQKSLFDFIKGSISWECLPFSSKRNNKNSKVKKSKADKSTSEGKYTKNAATLNPIISSEDDAYESMSSSKVKQPAEKKAGAIENSKPTKAAVIEASQTKHPYSASLVNNGFGFGFDLEGGDGDNQLTFIVNCHKNGDAAKKGLADGKFNFFV
jgi:hypothetical protein